ncbi:hypothetical protein FRC02_002269 [Tulasnella sp. 418]|nr:hypothetical protein FRC02_002269 [Tulasnella sp. 418]
MSTPSPQEIEREVAALRNIRRRSSNQGPGSIPLDPDLPPNIPDSPSAGGYWDNYPQESIPAGSSSPVSSDGAADDPAHLFWVPAHLHPELAPAEFRAFLKEHTTQHPDADGPVPGGLARSFSASGLGRKKSMLSRQYKPSANDGVEDENVVTVRRNRSSIYSAAGPQLTINDLQKLEELAEEAAKSDDPSKLRTVLRRSLSLNVSPSSFIDQMDDIPPDVEDADAPIIVPRPGQILRRAARTKIRKTNLPGDGGGHRFASTRRGARAAKPDIEIASDSGHDFGEPSSQQPTIRHVGDDQDRPVSFSAEAFILDAYGDRRESLTSNSSSADDDDNGSGSHHTHSSATPPTSYESTTSPPATAKRVGSPPLQPQSQQPIPPVPTLHHPTPQRHLAVPQQQPSQPQQTPSRTPSPGATSAERAESPPSPPTAADLQRRSPSAPIPTTSTPIDAQPYHLPPSPSPQPSVRSTKSEKTKEKEKKGLLKGMWSGDKKKEPKNERPGSSGSDKDPGFFGSLFGGKKKHEDTSSPSGGLLSGAGPAAAAALLGASKAKNQPPPPSPTLQASFSRYPIHVERAVYRLSHIKLANPRRPLYEQVLISNLMFWYLGVINKTTQPATSNANGTANEKKESNAAKDGASGNQSNGPQRDEAAEREKEKAEERERERERQEKERAEKERVERERMAEKKESGRRGTLVKNVPPGQGGPGSRRVAEMPVRGPQYEVQHMIMKQEGGHGGGGSSMMRGNSAPSPGQIQREREREGGYPNGPPSRQSGPPHHGPYGGPGQFGQPPHQGHPPPYPNQQQFSQFGGPPPPGPGNPNPEQWLGNSMRGDSPYAAAGPPPGPGRSRSPPQGGPGGYPQGGPGGPPGPGQRLPGRSISANAGGPRPPHPQQQRGPPPPHGGPNGGWGPPPPQHLAPGSQPQQRRGSSPHPPMGMGGPPMGQPGGGMMRRTSNGSEDDDTPLGWQQQQQREMMDRDRMMRAGAGAGR